LQVTVSVAQPEWDRRDHGLPRNKIAQIFVLVLCLNFQLLGNKRKWQSDSRWRHWLSHPEQNYWLHYCQVILNGSMYCNVFTLVLTRRWLSTLSQYNQHSDTLWA